MRYSVLPPSLVTVLRVATIFELSKTVFSVVFRRPRVDSFVSSELHKSLPASEDTASVMGNPGNAASTRMEKLQPEAGEKLEDSSPSPRLRPLGQLTLKCRVSDLAC